VGYYGGIDYGFGYIGIGYFGGYWSGNHFYYNRSVTRVGPSINHVYERPVVYNNMHYGAQPANRVSYNGGHGGINVQPRPTEIAAMRERHEAPMAIQHQARVEASQNHAQSFAANHGRPEEAFAQHGFANGHGIAPAPRGIEAARPVQPNGNEHGVNGAHPEPYNNAAPHGESRPENANPASRFGTRPATSQPNAEPPRYEHQPSRQPEPRVENRAAPQPRAEAPHVENRPQPQPRAEAPRPESRPMPQQHMEAPRPESRPMPQQHMQAPRPENHPAPQPHPQEHAAPQPHGGGGDHGHEGGGEHGHR